MAVVNSPSSTETIQRIALLCDRIDQNFSRSIEEAPSEQQLELLRAGLNRLAAKTASYSAIILTQVRIRTEFPNGRDSISLKRAVITSNKGLEFDGHKILVNEQKPDFYLLYNRRLVHVVLDSASENVVQIGADPADPWEINTFRTVDMQKPWNGAFISAVNIYGPTVIPIPTSMP